MLIISDDPVKPWCEWGVWVARCPQAWCVGMSHHGPYPGTGQLGTLGDSKFACPRCGNLADVEWPPNADDIDAVLQMRPMREHRNWLPGETLTQLIQENAAHGILGGLRENQAVQITADQTFEDRTILAGRTLLAIGGR